jgi:transposase-like protein
MSWVVSQTFLPLLLQPKCPHCGSRMDLVIWERLPASHGGSERQHFLCNSCGAKAIIPPLL